MNSRLLFRALIALPLLLIPAAAAAQDIPSSCSGYERLAVQSEQVGPGHFRFREKAEITCDTFKFFADEIDVYTDEDRVVATGNVLFTTPDTRISASRVEFDLETKTGTFYDATGTSKVKPQVGVKSMFGTQEADMQFRGEKLEKLGEKKYRITNGGFTSCLQPTARWEFTSGSLTINVDRYAVARNTIFRVKGVPLLYLPIIYYPLEEDDRATGFLLPSYGLSTIEGQTVRNAFFWAINRSMDLTLMHDWFSKAGQAVGSEFRYVAAPGSSGRVTASFLNEKAYVVEYPDGTRIPREAGRNYQVRGDLTQQLPGRFRLGAQANYFSDLGVQQLYNHNPYDFTRRESFVNANLSGQIAGLQIGATATRRRVFYSATSSVVTGAAPQVTISRPEQTIAGLPIYWGFTSEGASITSQTVTGDTIADRGRTRLDLRPTVRAPLSRLPWLNVAASLGWRATWWSRSTDLATLAVVDEPLARRFYEGQITATGPTFARVFDTPGLGFAQRWKHVVEPALTFGRTSKIDLPRGVLTDYDSSDLAVGGITRMNYSLSNRLYAKRGTGPASAAREIASFVVSQSYYADAKLAALDQAARDPSQVYFPQSKFSPIDAGLRVTPSDLADLAFAATYEHTTNTIRTLRANARLRVTRHLDLNTDWSMQRQPKDSPYADNPYYNAHALQGGATLRSERNTYGGSLALQYDVANTSLINRAVTAYYNPQCCGFAVEYSQMNPPSIGGISQPPYNRRFNISFTLAGIGSFSDFFGAFGADPYRR